MGKLGGAMTDSASTLNPSRATPRQVADHLSVAVPTVLRWWREGIIPARVAVGRVYRFDLAEVEAALAKRSQQPGGDSR